MTITNLFLFKTPTVAIPKPQPPTDISLSSPPHNQNFKSSSLFNDIQDVVHHTPVCRRATPATLLKAPCAANPQSSPEFLTSQMDVDQDVILKATAQISALQQQQHNSAIRSSVQNSAHARRLFDFNSNGSDMSSMVQQSTMNKKLQFDDSDNESDLCMNKPKTLSYESDDPLHQNAQSVSPVSSTSSWCSGANTQQLPQHLMKLKTLSSSSNSLFKPISRFTNPHQSSQFGRTTGLSNSSSAGLNSLRSPNSPFQFNQLHANINPFTPTNTFNSAKSNIITNINQSNLKNKTNVSLPEINVQKEL